VNTLLLRSSFCCRISNTCRSRQILFRRLSPKLNSSILMGITSQP